MFSDNNAGIDDSLIGGVIDRRYEGYRLIEQWTSYGWNVFVVQDGNAYDQVVAVLKTMEHWDPADRRPMAAIGKTVKGYWPAAVDRKIPDFGDQVVGCSKAQAELAIRELAKFHATWWESPRLAELDWVWAFNHPVRSAAAQGAYAGAWGPFKQLWAKQVPADVLAIGEKFHDALPKLLDRLAASPVTITHGDYRLDNLFFATPEGDPAVVDWQIIALGNGLFDVAYFMAGAVSPADRRALEMDLLRMYHGILLERGVKNYSFDQCLLDYRTSALFCWQYAVLILGVLDASNERGLALFTTVLERFVAIIVDLKAGSCCRRDALGAINDVVVGVVDAKTEHV
jgi:hypothetical protein